MSAAGSEDAARGASGAAGGETLSVQVQGGHGEPERLYVLSRPRDGVVDVREFRFGTADAGPLEYRAAAFELYDVFAHAQRHRRRLSEELSRIKLWLDGL